MTELYIDGQQVVLPDSFNINVTEENPIITKAGEYSYDLDIDLDNDANSKIYKHITRINNTEKLKNRKAILIVNNRVIINGIEVIIEITSKKASIQLVSGNSELNYVGNEEKVNQLDLGEMPAHTLEIARSLLHKSWPETNYVFTPIKVEDGGILNSVFNDTYTDDDNAYTGNYTGGGWVSGLRTYALNYRENAELVPQPFLMFYIVNIPEKFGFKIVENVLENDFMAKRAYIVNSINTVSYAKILPENWTTSDFITEIEKFFNVVYVIDKISKTCRIIRGLQNSVKREYLDITEDEYEIPIDSENNIQTVDYDCVSYDLPDDDYYKYNRLNNDAKKYLNHLYFDNYEGMLAYINTNRVLYNNTKTIFHVDDESYIFENYKIKNVDYLRDAGDFTKNTVKLKIIPAQITYSGETVWFSKPSYVTQYMTGYYQLPLVNSSKVENVDSTLTEIILDGRNEVSNNSETIAIALYCGIDMLRHDDGLASVNYGVGYNVILHCLWSQTHYRMTFIEGSHGTFFPFGVVNEDYYKLTLMLDGINGLAERCSYKNTNIDASQKYIISFPQKFTPDPRAEFIIKNKRFICEKLEYIVDKNGIGEKIKGYFYPAVESTDAKLRNNLLVNGAYIDSDKYTDTLHWNDTSTLPVVPDTTPEEPFVSTIARDQLLHDGQYIDPDKYTDSQPWLDQPTA